MGYKPVGKKVKIGRWRQIRGKERNQDLNSQAWGE